MLKRLQIFPSRLLLCQLWIILKIIIILITAYITFWFISSCVNLPCHKIVTNSGQLMLKSKQKFIELKSHKGLEFTNDLPKKDETVLIDLQNFTFTINHDICRRYGNPFFLIIVTSTPDHFSKRKVIRETWAKTKTPETVILFSVGFSEKHQSDLIKEDKTYGDIIQGNFIDDVRNKTYKHIMVLKWVTYYCWGAKYVLKVDDDVYVNIPAFVEFLVHEMSPWGARRLIFCNPIHGALVKRSWHSEWRVSPKEYSARHYPTYCSRWAILYSPDAMFLLYREAQKSPFFWIDNVHVTGTLVKKVNLVHASFKDRMFKTTEMYNILHDSTVNRHNFLIGLPNILEDDMKALYDLIS